MDDDKRCPKCNSANLVKAGRAGSGRTRWKCQSCTTRTTNPYQEQDEKTSFPKNIPKAKKYIFTAAQNATPTHKRFLKSLTVYAEHIGAVLVIIPFRYKNPTSNWSNDNENHEWWAEDAMPFIYDGRFNLNKSITVLGDIKVMPTAVTPLTGLESITGEMSGIVGHTKIQLVTIPTTQSKFPKIMVTTGACTIKNYSDTKAGKKGDFHHSIGAAIVELTRGGFHLRQISACGDGTFIDLENSVTPDGVSKAPPAEALVMGDTHVDFVDPDVIKATFINKNSIVKTLKPKKLLWHDLVDFYSRNHHHSKDPITLFAVQQSGMDDVRAEVQRACKFVDTYTPKGTLSILVPSNHPEAINRWLREADWRQDPVNAEFYLETALQVVRSARMGKGGATSIDPFLYWADKYIKTKVKLLDRDESCVIKKIECGLHGDKGANGARGNIRTFARIGVKTIVGHSHTPGISDGCYQTGTSTYLNRDYTSGLSSWLQTHCIIYANGKRSLINIISGEYRT